MSSEQRFVFCVQWSNIYIYIEREREHTDNLRDNLRDNLTYPGILVYIYIHTYRPLHLRLRNKRKHAKEEDETAQA